jgi:hypothetical protein
MPGSSQPNHLHARVSADLLSEVKTLATERRISVSQLVRSVVSRELADANSSSGSLPDESAIREMAILIAVELVLKLQEASMPGGTTLSRRLLEEAARSAIARLESVETAMKEAER